MGTALVAAPKKLFKINYAVVRNRLTSKKKSFGQQTNKADVHKDQAMFSVFREYKLPSAECALSLSKKSIRFVISGAYLCHTGVFT